jgi:hypothetical protein
MQRQAGAPVARPMQVAPQPVRPQAQMAHAPAAQQRRAAPGARRQGATRGGQRRAPAPAPAKKSGNGALYTGAFVVLATAVGAVLAKAILSFL